MPSHSQCLLSVGAIHYYQWDIALLPPLHLPPERHTLAIENRLCGILNMSVETFPKSGEGIALDIVLKKCLWLFALIYRALLLTAFGTAAASPM